MICKIFERLRRGSRFLNKKGYSKDLQTEKLLLSNNEHKRQLMNLLKRKLYYNTNLKNSIFRHLEGGEATWLSSDISTIPYQCLN